MKRTIIQISILASATALSCVGQTPQAQQVGIFRDGFEWVEDAGMCGCNASYAYAFGGITGDVPLTGDWGGNGYTSAGIFRAYNGVAWFLLDAQAITDIDVTAVEALHAVHEELQRKGIALKIAHANRPLRAILERTGLARELKEDSFFASVHECASAFQARPGRPPP